MIHHLKTVPSVYSAVESGKKTYEIRHVSDRKFNIGDIIHLEEYDPIKVSYTGRASKFEITYITPPGEWGLPENLCVFAIRRV